MGDASSTNKSVPLHVRVADDTWSFCLDSRLLATFLGDASDLCNLSICSQAFVSFRTQILRVQLKQADSRSALREAISNWRLPRLCALDVDLYDVDSKLDTSPLLALIIDGQVPSLKDLRLHVRGIGEKYVSSSVFKIMALPNLQRLRVRASKWIDVKVLRNIQKAALMYPHLTLELIPEPRELS